MSCTLDVTVGAEILNNMTKYHLILQDSLSYIKQHQTTSNNIVSCQIALFQIFLFILYIVTAEAVNVAQQCTVNGFISKVGVGVGRGDNERQFMFCNGRPVDLSKFVKAVNEVSNSETVEEKSNFFKLNLNLILNFKFQMI